MAHYDAARTPYTVYDAQNDREARKRMFAYSGGDPTVPVIVVDGPTCNRVGARRRAVEPCTNAPVGALRE